MSTKVIKNYKTNYSIFSAYTVKQSNHAITLVSLIVTIIIILILAGIGITTSMKLIEQTKRAEFIAKMRAQEEALQFTLTEYEMQLHGRQEVEYPLTDKVTDTQFNEFSTELQKTIIDARTAEGITDKEDIFKLNKSITVTEDYASVYDGKIGSIYKINPVEIGGKKVFGTGNKGILVGGSGLLSKPIEPEEPIVEIINGVPVPIGFSYLEGTKETGFVIKNNNDGNEFVWIPTDLVPYQTYDWGKYYAATAYKEYYGTADDEAIIQDINESVAKNKGYYISRYEMGTTVKRTTEGQPLTTPVSKATSAETPIYAYNYITWDQARDMCNGLYNRAENNVQSRLINARGWDTALRFIETIEPKDTTFGANSLNKGWYSNNSGGQLQETGKPINANKDNMKKNIYDMGGNMYEWTADQYTPNITNRSVRGGCCDSDGSYASAGFRDYLTYSSSSSEYGVRESLYL